jgi:hypothetical protein
MSLDFNYKNVKDHNTLMFHEDGSIKAVSEAIIFNLMRIGITAITEENWEKVFTRIHMMELVDKPLLIASNYDGEITRIPITPEDIKAHIGLSTNVSTESDAAFKKKIMQILTEKAEFNLKQFKAEEAKTAYL